MHRNVLFLLVGQVLILGASGRAGPRTGAPAEASPPASSAERQGTLTLSDALALALAHNPDLGVFPYELRAADARVLQARLHPNPELELEVEEFAGSGERNGFDAAETTLRLGQPIELGGKRAKRTRVAALGRELVQWDYESARLDVVRDTTKAFTAVLAAQDRLAVAEQLLALSREAQDAVAKRVEAGRDSPVDDLRAGVVVSSAQIEVRRAQGLLTAARHNLAARWGGQSPSFERAAGDLSEIPASMPPEDAAVLADNPDIARWQAEEQQRRAALRLQKAGAWPDLTVAGGLQRFEETDDTALVFGLSLPLPLFDRNQGGIAEATANLGKARREYEAVRARTLAALAEARSLLAVAHDEVLLLRQDVLPKAEQAFQSTQEGYRQGKFDYLYVLDAQRTLFETRARYVDSLEAYHAVQADVARLTGTLPGGLRTELTQEKRHEE